VKQVSVAGVVEVESAHQHAVSACSFLPFLGGCLLLGITGQGWLKQQLPPRMLTMSHTCMSTLVGYQVSLGFVQMRMLHDV
jgi:hypothetical protein